MEDGTIVLVGATTENPSFELNAALLSRAQVLCANRLDEAALGQLLARAEAGEGRPLPLDAARRASALIAHGRRRRPRAPQPGRAGDLAWPPAPPLDPAGLRPRAAAGGALRQVGDGHYNLISALHKSVRGSDPDAALYWLARMLEGGEDPRYLARRITRMAVEDIGLADPQAQALCLQAWQTYERLGSPGGRARAGRRRSSTSRSRRSRTLCRLHGLRRRARGWRRRPARCRRPRTSSTRRRS
jgi:putative ATPase